MQNLEHMVIQVRERNVDGNGYHPIVSQVGHRQSFNGDKWDFPVKGCY